MSNLTSEKKILLYEVSLEDLVQEIKKSLLKDLEEMIKKSNKESEQDEYLTRKEVSQLLKIDISTLYRWTQSGIITACYLGNRVYYRKSEIDKKLNLNANYITF